MCQGSRDPGVDPQGRCSGRSGQSVLHVVADLAGLVDVFANATEIFRPDLTHFMPMEAPDEIAAIIGEEISGT
ncbi:MAG: hypothetical protein GY789_05525 [Hyphomicrobiales bacterium]|nr:hypothetical protein [Hyphomicrobiales bacterium]